jgi:hypothetical protein
MVAVATVAATVAVVVVVRVVVNTTALVVAEVDLRMEKGRISHEKTEIIIVIAITHLTSRMIMDVDMAEAMVEAMDKVVAANAEDGNPVVNTTQMLHSKITTSHPRTLHHIHPQDALITHTTSTILRINFGQDQFTKDAWPRSSSIKLRLIVFEHLLLLD